MAWDFETDPEFEEQLVWMRAFVDRELIPLEPIFDHLPADEWSAVKIHLQDQVKAQGQTLCGRHLAAQESGTRAHLMQRVSSLSQELTISPLPQLFRMPKLNQLQAPLPSRSLT